MLITIVLYIFSLEVYLSTLLEAILNSSYSERPKKCMNALLLFSAFFLSQMQICPIRYGPEFESGTEKQP